MHITCIVDFVVYSMNCTNLSSNQRMIRERKREEVMRMRIEKEEEEEDGAQINLNKMINTCRLHHFQD